jgi:hypothetical protein
MGFQTTLITQVGAVLVAAGVGKMTGAGSNDVLIVSDQLPQSPDRAIAISTYPVQDDATTDSIIGVQLRVRGKANDRASTKDILDGCFDTLHGIENTVWAGIPIVRVWHQSGANLGPDTGNRLEATANYYIQCTRPGPNRED